MAIRIETPQNKKNLIQNYTDASDEQLIKLAQFEDGKAFDVLMNRHAGMIYKLAKDYLGSGFDADDLYQEMCLTVWQKKDLWKAEIAKFSTWLYRIISNKCIDILRARKNFSSSDILEEWESDAPKAFDVLALKQLQHSLSDCLKILPEQQRRALMMLYYEDKNVSTICDEMILSEDSVRSLLKRGKQKLRQVVPTEHYANF